MVFSLDDNFKAVAKIKVVGVGGAGGNAVNRMVQSGLSGVEFIAINTDAMALDHNLAEVRIQIGDKLTAGLGAGAKPQVGMMAMQEDIDRVRAQLEGADMVFIAAGMGGGTGTGAAPVVAEIAQELGILTVAVVTKPFMFEGPVRDKNARQGLEALRKAVDTIIVIPNQKLLSVIDKNTSFRDAFKKADEVLTSATKGISDIILRHGDIQVDFADVRAIMSQGGDALMGTATASGENRATVAADKAIHSPLLDNVSIAGSTGVLVNITGGEDLGMMEVSEAMNFIYEAVGAESNTNIIFGTVIEPSMKDDLSITVIATGFGEAARKSTDRKAGEPARREEQSVYIPEIRTYQHRPEKPAQESLFPEKPARQVQEPAPQVRPQAQSPAAPSAARPEPPKAVRPQEDDTKVFYSENRETSSAPAASRDASSRKPNFLPFTLGKTGRHSDQDSDVDYETPAFLRHQAD